MHKQTNIGLWVLAVFACQIQAKEPINEFVHHPFQHPMSQSIQQSMPQPMQADNVAAAHAIGVNRVWAGGALGISLTGQGVTIGLWDVGSVNENHLEFGGRVTQMDNAIGNAFHATHVAGTILAEGLEDVDLYPEYNPDGLMESRGMANHAFIRAYDTQNDLNEIALEAANGLILSNHSYSKMLGWEFSVNKPGDWTWYGDTGVAESEDYRFGYYDERAQSWDQLGVTEPHHLLVKSAGNDRNEGPNSQPVNHWVWDPDFYTYVPSTTIRHQDGNPGGFDSLVPGGTAKNILTVGSVHDIPQGYKTESDVVMTHYSAWGPTDDGRIKPDIVANGEGLLSPAGNGYLVYSGTSQAAASVTGALALIQEYHNEFHNEFMSANALKALTIATADEAGDFPGPDFKFGWGLMNTARAVNIVKQDYFHNVIREGTINEDFLMVHKFELGGDMDYKVALVWNDPAATVSPPAVDLLQPKLVNQLDLRVFNKGVIEYPWRLDFNNPDAPAIKGAGYRDNVEVVEFSTDSSGEYDVAVSHTGSLQSGSQDYALVLWGKPNKFRFNFYFNFFFDPFPYVEFPEFDFQLQAKQKALFEIDSPKALNLRIVEAPELGNATLVSGKYLQYHAPRRVDERTPIRIVVSMTDRMGNTQPLEITGTLLPEDRSGNRSQ